MYLSNCRGNNNRFTESQNCRDWKTIESNPPAKAGTLIQVAQVVVQPDLEYLHKRRLQNFSGQPVPVLCHPYQKEVLPHVSMELQMVKLQPIIPCPIATRLEQPSLTHLPPTSLQIFINIYQIPSFDQEFLCQGK